jgi:hypothetical protein
MTAEDGAAPPLKYRLATEADVPALNRLWADDAGWGGLSLAQWHDWYVNTPHGPCTVGVGEQEDGRIVSQMAFTPVRVLVDGVERKALRLSAPIVSTSLRRSMRDLSHPVVQMYLTAVQAAVADGVELVYSLPDRAWLGFFRWARRVQPDITTFQTQAFTCRAISLAAGAPAGQTMFSAGEFERFDGEFDAFWSRVRDSAAQPMVVRNASWLAYKLGGATVRVAMRDETGTLVGYAAVREKDGLLLDALSADPAHYEPLLQRTCSTLAAARAAGRPLPAELHVMNTPTLGPALDALGASAADFTFAMIVAAMPGGPPVDDVAPARWLVCGGD